MLQNMKMSKKLLNGLIVTLVLLSFGMNTISVQASTHTETLTLYTDKGFLWSRRYYRVDIITYYQIVPEESYITGARMELYTRTSGGFPPSLYDFYFQYHSGVNGYWTIYYPNVYDNGYMELEAPDIREASDNFDGDLSAETQETNRVKYCWVFDLGGDPETGCGTYSWTVPPINK